jgi:hypothetical protein
MCMIWDLFVIFHYTNHAVFPNFSLATVAGFVRDH